jgi:hypothetical protein
MASNEVELNVPLMPRDREALEEIFESPAFLITPERFSTGTA